MRLTFEKIQIYNSAESEAVRGQKVSGNGVPDVLPVTWAKVFVAQVLY